MSAAPTRVAVIGAGMAGAACARSLADAGFEVQVFDKSRGVGGRLSTRRASWAAAGGAEQQARFDHGAPGFSAQGREFVRFAEQAGRDGLLSRWLPRVAPGGYAPLDEPDLWLPTPDMPALCRAVLAGLPLHLNSTVEALRPGPAGWALESAGSTLGEGFDAVAVALPPQQAAALLRPHQAEWAQRAGSLPMLPAWVLMAVTDDPAPPPAWDLGWPSSGPLACVVRNDAKPGRERVPGQAHWVVHATAAWSQTHLESPAAEVQGALQAALAAWLGRPLAWQHVAVHRWRYASVPRATQSAAQAATHPGTPACAASPSRCWWDAALGLGVCGDALGGAGVEGAWHSGRALAAQVIEHRPAAKAQRRATTPSVSTPKRTP